MAGAFEGVVWESSDKAANFSDDIIVDRGVGVEDALNDGGSSWEVNPTQTGIQGWGRVDVVQNVLHACRPTEDDSYASATGAVTDIALPLWSAA